MDQSTNFCVIYFYNNIFNPYFRILHNLIQTIERPVLTTAGSQLKIFCTHFLNVIFLISVRRMFNFFTKRGITTTGRTSTRKRGITSTLCWEPFPRFKIFFWDRPCLKGSSVPNKLTPPLLQPPGASGAASNPNKHHFHNFFSQNLI